MTARLGGCFNQPQTRHLRTKMADRELIVFVLKFGVKRCQCAVEAIVAALTINHGSHITIFL